MKTRLKILFDIVMLFTLGVLYNSHILDMTFHEATGLFLCGLFVLHCLFNIKWIMSVTRRLFDKTLPVKTKANWIVNLLLLAAFAVILISGVAESQALFPQGGKHELARGIHHFAAGIVVILTGVHLGLHWGMVMGVFRKLIKIPAKITKPTCYALLIFVSAFGVYNIVTGGFAGLLTAPFSVSQNEKAENPKGDEGKGGYHDGVGSGDKSGEQKNNTQNAGDDHIEKASGSPNGFLTTAAATVAEYVSVMAIFAAGTYYIGKRKI